MNLLQALVLGIVQGLTEFLPVSSSGHLVIVPAILRWEPAPLVFDTTVHLGTLLAVVTVFWRDIGVLLVAWWQGLRRRRPLETPEARLGWYILLGTVPAVAAGLLLEDLFESLFSSSRAVGGFLLLTAFLLLLAEVLGRRRRALAEMTWADALWIGLAQAASIAPGLSRSGTTMATGMFRGLARESAARFSFLLSIPIIAGTGLMQLFKLVLEGQWQSEVLPLMLGLLAAALSGYAAIRFLLAYVRRRPLYPFVAYCVILGLVALFAL